MTKEYLSDEELQRLIDEAERAPLLAAPSYLKTEILQKADRMALQPVQKTDRPVLPPSWQFVVYSLKVGLAAAAAVLALLYIPMKPGEFSVPRTRFQVEAKETLFSGITSMVDQKTNEFCGYLSELTNRKNFKTGGYMHDK